MKFLAVHPSCLMYSKIYLRLEPLGLELVAAAARREGHSIRLIDLQCEPHENFFRLVKRWKPDVIAFSVNYLANVPEIIDLARATRALLPETFICVGGHSVSFIPEEILRHAAGALDCVMTGEGETAITGLGCSRPKSAKPEERSRLRNTRPSRPTARIRKIARRLVACTRPGSTSPEIFHRPIRPGRIHRI
jgi:radical SAM superfamily enzyme YgiQ (UPF0313 family)